MARIALVLVVEVLLAILVALGLGALLQWGLGVSDLGSAAAESARQLVFFLDVGLVIWVVTLVFLTARGRALPGVGATLVAALIGFVVNALTVLVVSLVQGGRTTEFLTYAIGAGVAFLVAVLVVAPVIRRLFSPSVNTTS